MTVEILTALAHGKARGSAALEKQWVLALQRLASSGVTDAVFAKLAAAASSPSAVSRLARLLCGDAEAGSDVLFANCDASSHGLEQWIDALDSLSEWLEKHGRHETLMKCLGYISCASEGSPEVSLPWVVVQMLEQYGMDK